MPLAFTASGIDDADMASLTTRAVLLCVKTTNVLWFVLINTVIWNLLYVWVLLRSAFVLL